VDIDMEANNAIKREKGFRTEAEAVMPFNHCCQYPRVILTPNKT
jgi:hypothetical protein